MDDIFEIVCSNKDLTSICVSLSMFRGRLYCHIREYITPDNGDNQATYKGVSIPPEHIDTLIYKLEKLSKAFCELSNSNSKQLSFKFE